MTRMIHHLIELDGYETHVREWGAGNPETIVLWHGLARTGADFTAFAEALCDRWHLLAPDTLGRGRSAWAHDPDTDYAFRRYERQALALCDHFGVDRLRWVGTSMGGALGIRVAAGALAGRVTHLVVNDIGPELPDTAVQRILTYVGNPPDFATLTELEAYLRQVYKPYGWLSDEQWRVKTLTSYRRRDDGRITLHYDPAIVRQWVHHAGDYDLWDAWDRLACPTLVLRGAESDLLLPELAEAMMRRNPRAVLRVEEGCGHAPALNRPAQIDPVRAFLES